MDKRGMCGKLIKQINDEMQKRVNNLLRCQDMTMTQMEVLRELTNAPAHQYTLKELEPRLHVAQSTAAGIVARLEQKGLVEGLSDPADRRIKLVRITPAGLQRVADTHGHMLAAEEKLLSSLTETEREIFFVLLKKVHDTLR